MCILRCHIIFWGDKTITNLGITSRNVTLQNVNVTSHKVRRREDMFYFALIATLWRTASKYGNNVYHYEECWFAAVSCLCIRDLQSFWWWIVMEMIPDRSGSGNGERVDETCWVELWTAEMSFQSGIPSDWWTVYIFEFLMVNRMNIFVKTFILLRREMWLFQLLLLERFSSSIHHLPHFQPGRRTFIISLLVSTKTSISSLQLELWIVINIISNQFRETV